MKTRVPVHGGPFDGSLAELENVSENQLIYLRGVRYNLEWSNGKPQLVYGKEVK